MKKAGMPTFVGMTKASNGNVDGYQAFSPINPLYVFTSSGTAASKNRLPFSGVARPGFDPIRPSGKRRR
jgi:hypothetical protein